jgi:3-phosphoshikimate 1-carboxyvinyltransferase
MNMPAAHEALIINRFPSGVVTAPPSKSVSHRALICAALVAGASSIDRIENLGESDDIRATRAGILAIVQRQHTGGVCTIDCNESGSTLRFLMPIAAALGGQWRFGGRGRLMERPLGVYEELFPAHGVQIWRKTDIPGPATACCLSGKLTPGVFSFSGGVSSQFVSGLLLALPLLDGDSEIRLSSPLESASYVNLTLQVMRAYGLDGIEQSDDLHRYYIRGGRQYKDRPFRVEGDYSQAAFFLCAAKLGCDVRVAGLNPQSMQGDRRILDLLDEAVIDAGDIPDLVPPLAALACSRPGMMRITNAGRLRLKESDRLQALTSLLGGLGADIRESDDGLMIRGKAGLNGGNAQAWNDHRIAMAAALAAIVCKEPVHLSGWQSVSKSYPHFWQDWLVKERT